MRFNNLYCNNMTLKDLIKSHSWLSVKQKLYELFPDEQKNDNWYEIVYGQLEMMPAIDSNMLIVLKTIDDDKLADEPYVDVSGREISANGNDDSELSVSYALEFRPWEEWLGMWIDKNSIQEFSQLEIIMHCLYEMTFMGFDQKEIKNEYDKIIETSEEIKNMTDEEKEKKFISWDKLKDDLQIDDEE